MAGMLDADGFEASLTGTTPPAGLDTALLALWHAGRDAWKEGHDLVAHAEDARSAWVHAHLHRIEGDLGNAAYWYRRTGRPTASGDLTAERRAIAAALLAPE